LVEKLKKSETKYLEMINELDERTPRPNNAIYKEVLENI
jgi:hypothetical protein